MRFLKNVWRSMMTYKMSFSTSLGRSILHVYGVFLIRVGVLNINDVDRLNASEQVICVLKELQY